MDKLYFKSLDFLWTHFVIEPRLPDAESYKPNHIAIAKPIPFPIGLYAPDPADRPHINVDEYQKDMIRIQGYPYYCWRKINA